MAERLQIETKLGAVTQRPTAAPVDQFVQVNPNGKAAQLARALQEFAPSAAKLGWGVVDRKHEQDTKEGAALAQRLALKQKTYEQAVKEGLIPRGANPFFYAGVKEQFGRALAGKMTGDLMAAVANNPKLQASTNIADFDEAAREFMDAWSEKNVPEGSRDEFFDAGFNASAVANMQNQRNSFAAQIMGRIERLGDEALHAETAQIVRTLQPDGANRAEVLGQLQTLADTLVQEQGRNGTQVMRTMASAIAKAATTSAKPSLKMLELMREVRGKDGLFVDTAAGSEMYAQARHDITREIEWRNNVSFQQAERERVQREREVYSEAVGMLVKNPQANLRGLLAANRDLQGLDGTLDALRRRWTGMRYDDDAETVGGLTARIWVPNGRPVTPREIVGLINQDAGGITAQTASSLLSMLDQKNRADSAGGDDPIANALRDHGYMDEKTTLRDRLAGALSGKMVDAGQRLANAEAKLAIFWVEFLATPEAQAMSWTQRRQRLNVEAARIAESEEAKLKVRVDGRGAAWDAQGNATKSGPPPKPRLTREQTLSVMEDLVDGKLSRETRSLMQGTLEDLDTEVDAAAAYYQLMEGK